MGMESTSKHHLVHPHALRQTKYLYILDRCLLKVLLMTSSCTG